MPIWLISSLVISPFFFPLPSQLYVSATLNLSSLSILCGLQLPYFCIYCSLSQNALPSSYSWKHLFNLQIIVHILPSLGSISWLPEAGNDTLALRPLCLSPTLSCAHFMFQGYQTHYFPSTPCCFMCHAFPCIMTVPPSRIKFSLPLTWLTPSYPLSSAQEPSIPESLPWTT